MARTVSDVTTRARDILKDQGEPYRYSDGELLNAVNDALIEVRRVRADLFLSRSFAVPLLTAPESKLPIEDQYFNTVVWFVVGYMMLRDDEFAVDGRALSMIQKATGQLLASAS